MLYLLTQEVFKGSYLGPRDKDSIDLWQQVLTAAARAESPMTQDSRYLTDAALDEFMASGPKTAFRIPGVPEVQLVFLPGAGGGVALRVAWDGAAVPDLSEYEHLSASVVRAGSRRGLSC